MIAVRGCEGLSLLWDRLEPKSGLDPRFELRRVRESQNASCGVRPEVHRPNATSTADSIPRNL